MNNTNITDTFSKSSSKVESLQLTLFTILTIILLISSLLGLFLNGLLTRVIFKCTGAMPQNVRLFLINCSIGFTWQMFTLNLKAIYHIALIILGTRRMIIDQWTCSIGEFMHVESLLVIPILMLLVSLERFSATLMKKTSDKLSRLMIFSCIIAWILPCITYFIEVYYSSLEEVVNPHIWDMVLTNDTTKYRYCHWSLLLKASFSNPWMFSIIGCQVFTCLLFLLIMWLNKKRLGSFSLTSTAHNLAERFSLWANVNTAKWLIPASGIVCFAKLAAFVICTSARNMRMDVATYRIFVCLSLCIIALESLAFPILLFRYNEYITRILFELYPNLKKFPCINRLLPGHAANKVCSLDKDNDPQQNNEVLNLRAVGSITHSQSVTYNNNNGAGSGRNFRVDRCGKMASPGRKVVEYRLRPDENVDILSQMWNQAKSKGEKK